MISGSQTYLSRLPFDGWSPAGQQHTEPRVEEMMPEVADNVTGLCVSNAAHWIAEDNPGAFTGDRSASPQRLSELPSLPSFRFAYWTLSVNRDGEPLLDRLSTLGKQVPNLRTTPSAAATPRIRQA